LKNKNRLFFRVPKERTPIPLDSRVATAKDPCNYYEVNDGVPNSIQVETAKESSNEEVDKNNNSDPFKCDILPDVSSGEDETASMKYLKRNSDPSLR
jgi:hypothetical protein